MDDVQAGTDPRSKVREATISKLSFFQSISLRLK
jgi:hypothetical protein